MIGGTRAGSEHPQHGPIVDGRDNLGASRTCQLRFTWTCRSVDGRHDTGAITTHDRNVGVDGKPGRGNWQAGGDCGTDRAGGLTRAPPAGVCRTALAPRRGRLHPAHRSDRGADPDWSRDGEACSLAGAMNAATIMIITTNMDAAAIGITITIRSVASNQDRDHHHDDVCDSDRDGDSGAAATTS